MNENRYLYSKFTKYEILKQLISQLPSAKVLSTAPVDIYIDLQSIYSQILAQSLLSNDNKILSVNVMNLAAHYRHFFRHYMSTESRVFIVNGLPSSNSIASIENNQSPILFELMKNLVPYFPCTYYINKRYNACAIIGTMIQQETMKYNHSAFVVSTDVYSYQLPIIYQNTFILRPSLQPRIVSYNTIYTYMYPRNKSVDMTQLNPGLLPLIMAYYKCPELDLDMVNNFKSTIKIIKDKISTGKLLNGYNSINISLSGENNIGIRKRIMLCDLMTLIKSYEYSYDNLDASWRIYKQCDVQTLSTAIDSKINIDPEHILNYIFLLDIDVNFANRFINNR